MGLPRDLLNEALKRARAMDAGETPRYSVYCPHTPTPKQRAFMNTTVKEGLFGGAAGGGKSDAILMDVLQYVHKPRFSALLLRKTFADLNRAGSLIPRLNSWLTGTDAKRRDGGRIWEFPSGARIEFGYLENKDDELNYQSAEYNYVGFDELTQHNEDQYTFLFSRVRSAKDDGMPNKIRSTTNPGGPGHEWVHARFIAPYEDELKKIDMEDRTPKVFSRRCNVDLGPPFGEMEYDSFFIPSLALDNPFLDFEDYKISLAFLTPVQREQMLRGDWDIRTNGENFKLEWFKTTNRTPVLESYIRSWDTSVTKSGDPTASTLMGKDGRKVYLCDQSEDQTDVADLVGLIVRKHQGDPPGTVIAIEDTGISKPLIFQLRQRQDLEGVRILAVPVGKITGPGQKNDKLARATAWINALSDGELILVEGDWNDRFISQCLRFTNEKSDRDDLIDSVSVGYSQIFKHRGGTRPTGTTTEIGSPNWYLEEVARHQRQQNDWF